MRSMTGYGRAVARADGREITIELKSVNHRFLDINIRAPRSLGFLEEGLRAMTGAACERGHIDIYVSYQNEREDAKAVQLDEGLALAYAGAFERLGAVLESKSNSIALEQIARMPDVLRVIEAQEDQEAVIEVTREAFFTAAERLLESREAEGARLLRDISARLDAIEAALRAIEADKEGAAAIHAKLVERIEALIGDAAVDPARVAQEAAFLADRAAIDEETVRLSGHIASMRETLKADGAQGRRLEFITQEMNRETNTIGSKSSEMSVTQRVLEIKGELEKIREQVQNIE